MHVRMKLFQRNKISRSSTTLLRPRRSRLFRGVARERQKQTFRERDSAWSIWTLGYMFLWGSFLGAVVFALFFSPFLRIDREDIAPMEHVSRDAVSALIQRELSGKFWGILPNNTMLIAFARRRGIEQKLLETFPVLRSVTTSFVFPGTIVVKGEERTLALVLCSGGPCFAVDERGFAFDEAPAPDMGNTQGVLTVVDVSAKPVVWQDPLFSEDFLRVFPSIRGRLSDELGIDTVDIAETPSRFSDEVWLRTVDGWELRMSATVSIEKSLRALRLLFAKTLPENDRKNLDYIDLRTENRIFYALKGDTQREGESDAEDTETHERKKK